MKAIINDVLKCAILGNLFHIVIAVIYSMTSQRNQVVSTVFLILILLIWMLCGIYYSLIREEKKESQILILSLISVSPHIIIIIISQIISGIDIVSQVQNYNLFFIIGAPILLWHKPLAPIMSLFDSSSFYIQISINILIIFFLIFLGGFIGKVIYKKTHRV